MRVVTVPNAPVVGTANDGSAKVSSSATTSANVDRRDRGSTGRSDEALDLGEAC